VSFESPQESWASALRRLDALERSGLGWDGIGSYRRLVAEAAASEFAGRLFALGSHDLVVISPASGWPARASRSSVALRPRSDGQVAMILSRHRRRQPASVEERVFPLDREWSELVPWLRQLCEDGA
jgi:hypothetical protein